MRVHGVCLVCLQAGTKSFVAPGVFGVFPGLVSFSWLFCGPGRVPSWLCEFCSLCVSFACGPFREPRTTTNCAVLARAARSEWDSPIIFQSLSRHKLRRAAQVFHPRLDEGLLGVFNRGEQFFLVNRVSRSTTWGIGLYGVQQEAFAQEVCAGRS